MSARAMPGDLGPEIARADRIPRKNRLTAAIGAGVVVAAIGAFEVWRGLNVFVVVALLAICFALMLYGSFGLSVRAGSDWIATGEAYVLTQRLTAVRARVGPNGTLLHLADDGGRSIEPYLDNLNSNAKIWQVVCDGVAAARRRGVEIDTVTGRFFPG